MSCFAFSSFHSFDSMIVRIVIAHVNTTFSNVYSFFRPTAQ